jgi:hypothetical protein
MNQTRINQIAAGSPASPEEARELAQLATDSDLILKSLRDGITSGPLPLDSVITIGEVVELIDHVQGAVTKYRATLPAAPEVGK